MKLKKIIRIESRTTTAGKEYWRTYALTDDGDEVTGYGRDFVEGQDIEVFFDDRWHTAKMQHKKPKKSLDIKS